MTRREFSKATKRAALERSGHRCEAAGRRYGFDEGQRCNCNLSLGVQFDHCIADGLGGDNSLGNCRAVCIRCHSFKTRNDVAQIAKMKRQKDRHTGVSRPAGSIRSTSTLPRRQPRDPDKGMPPLPKRSLYEERT